MNAVEDNTILPFRKIKLAVEEFFAKSGQQIAVVTFSPESPKFHPSQLKVIGSKPLEGILTSYMQTVLQQIDLSIFDNPDLQSQHDSTIPFQCLPPLSVEGIATSLEKMTQAQLRTFIPVMLRYATGRAKPGWGYAKTRPSWWPESVPWANLRCDIRSEEEKSRVPWTEALRTITRSCYKHFRQEHLLISDARKASDFSPLQVPPLKERTFFDKKPLETHATSPPPCNNATFSILISM